MKKYILREKYVKKVIPFINNDIIKVFIGQRRVGKSYLLYQVIDQIKNNDDKAHIIFINMELNEFDKIKNYQDLYEYIKNNSSSSKINYLFIDEIQMIDGFENTLRSLLAEGNYDIYCTGSNAKLLSGELATYLSGRYIEIVVNPLSYNEFLVFHNLQNLSQSLDLYLKYGGLPYIKNLNLTDEIVFDYLKNIYQAILYRDIISRYQIRNVNFFNKLIAFLAGNIGSLVSARNISKFLKSQNINISTTVLINYIEYLNIAFFIRKVNRVDIQGKKIFEIGEKHYFNDIGIRNAISGFKPFDLGIIIENVVYNHLNINDYNILIGKTGDKEIDFICEKNGERMYIQVALRILEKQTVEREYGNLLKIKDNYPKYVITLDDYTGSSYEGINHLPLRKFLSEFE